jgi:hypothetical protein
MSRRSEVIVLVDGVVNVGDGVVCSGVMKCRGVGLVWLRG